MPPNTRGTLPKQQVQERVVELCAGLDILTKAYHCAGELGRSAWDFAVELATLRAAGLTETNLRWLVCNGYIEHAIERRQVDTAGRSFAKGGRLWFSDRTCVVLTPAGADYAGTIVVEPATEEAGQGGVAKDHRPGGKRIPRWDPSCRVLRLGKQVVKCYRRWAPNQEMILGGFERAGWTERIDDPLPDDPQLEPRERLHDAIKNLNRGQRLLRFRGDGTGRGVCWELVRRQRR
jgi:hypothetical protein